jgi:hypothetical protein
MFVRWVGPLHSSSYYCQRFSWVFLFEGFQPMSILQMHSVSRILSSVTSLGWRHEQRLSYTSFLFDREHIISNSSYTRPGRSRHHASCAAEQV